MLISYDMKSMVYLLTCQRWWACCCKG